MPAGKRIRDELRKSREEKDRMAILDRALDEKEKLIQKANAALVENKLSAIVLSIHTNDLYPHRPQHIFVPPLTEGFLPIIERYDTHFFEIGITDADYATVHFCAGHKNVPEENMILQKCALQFLKQNLDGYDFAVMTDNENYFVDTVMLTQRMQYLQSRPMQYKQGWGDLTNGRWSLTTNYLRVALTSDPTVDTFAIDPAVIIPGTPFLIPLPDRDEHTRRRVRNQVLYANGVTFHVGHHVMEASHPECVHPVALILVYGRGEEKVASAIRKHIMKTFSCEHDVFLVDNGNIGNVRWRGRYDSPDDDETATKEGWSAEKDANRPRSSTDSSTDSSSDSKNKQDPETLISVQIHTKRSKTYAMRMGVRAADAIGKLKRRPFEAYGFVDVKRLDFSEGALEVGWLSKLMDQMYKTDAIAIHPALSYDSSTSYPFMKTQTRVATQHYRNELDESSCCSQVWILGDAVLPLYDAAWFKSVGGMDVRTEHMLSLEIEWSYWSRKANHKMVVSESVLVSRRNTDDKSDSQKKKQTINKFDPKLDTLLEGTDVLSICRVFEGSFGTAETKWPEVLLFGGSANERVARLAESNGKKVLYKPSGSMLNVLMKPHQKPSIDEIKDMWKKQCYSGDVGPSASTVNTGLKLSKHIVFVGGVGHGIEVNDSHGISSSNNMIIDIVVFVVVLLLAGIVKYVLKGKRKRGKDL
jgi:hypothetical protein